MKDQSLDVQTSPPSPLAPVAAPIKKKRGFAVMDRTTVQEFGRRGGVAAHVLGKAHEFNSDEARAAGRKGGLAANAERKSSGEPEATVVAAE
jgi:general stress protein YciG